VDLASGLSKSGAGRTPVRAGAVGAVAAAAHALDGAAGPVTRARRAVADCLVLEPSMLLFEEVAAMTAASTAPGAAAASLQVHPPFLYTGLP
jgi:hypothetical protein